MHRLSKGFVSVYHGEASAAYACSSVPRCTICTCKFTHMSPCDVCCSAALCCYAPQSKTFSQSKIAPSISKNKIPILSCKGSRSAMDHCVALSSFSTASRFFKLGLSFWKLLQATNTRHLTGLTMRAHHIVLCMNHTFKTM